MLKLTRENYFSLEANRKYMSNSQYKRLCGCEVLAMAEINGKWKSEETEFFLQGKYVHAWNDGTLKQFCAENPDCFKLLSMDKILSQIQKNALLEFIDSNLSMFKDGKLKKTIRKDDLLECLEISGVEVETRALKSSFEICNQIIYIILNDELFLRSLEGQKEVMFTAPLFGLEWKILIDAYNPEQKRFADLKILKSLSDKFGVREKDGVAAHYENVFDYRGYYTQVAIYAEIERLANGRAEGDYFTPYISVATKEKYPDKVIVNFESEETSLQEFIAEQLLYVQSNIEHIKNVKNGNIEPARCETCDYCKSTKRLIEPKHYTFFNLY